MRNLDFLWFGYIIVNILHESPLEETYDEGEVAGDEAVATVACVLLFTGFFRTSAIPVAAGEEEKCCALHLDFCPKARTTVLAGYDRSILSRGGRRNKEKRGEDKRGEEICLVWLGSGLCSCLSLHE